MKLSLGNQIRSNRLRLDMTQEQLAEKFGTSPQAISRWENGTTYPDIEMLPMIASFFGTTVDTLLGCTDEEKERFCQDLQKSLTTATKEKDVEKTIEILRKIRRNLREYQRYWFWGLYRDLWNSRLFKNEQVLDEMRLLADEIFSVCPRSDHFAVIENMAYMENDDNSFFETEYKSFRKRLKERGLKANEDVTNELLDFDRFPGYEDSRGFDNLNFHMISTPEKDLIKKDDNVGDLLEMQCELSSGLIDETDITPELHNALERLYDQQIHILNIEKAVTLVYSFMLLSITAEQMRKAGLKAY